jgi:hypothetical protein
VWRKVYRFLRLAMLANADVGQHFLLQNFLGVTDSRLFGHSRLGPAGADEVQGHMLFLDHEGLVQTWLDQLHHFLILKVVNDVLQNVTIGHKAEGPENDDDVDLLIILGWLI